MFFICLNLRLDVHLWLNKSYNKLVNNLNINHLLDEDHLTPAQEREIRRLFKYNIETSAIITHGPNSSWNKWYILHYSNPMDMDNVLAHKMMSDNLLELKTRAYRIAIMFLIQVKANKMIDSLLIPQIENILNEGVLLEARNNPKTALHFGSGCVIEIPHADNMKLKSLYMAFKLIKASECI